MDGCRVKYKQGNWSSNWNISSLGGWLQGQRQRRSKSLGVLAGSDGVRRAPFGSAGAAQGTQQAPLVTKAYVETWPPFFCNNNVRGLLTGGHKLPDRKVMQNKCLTSESLLRQNKDICGNYVNTRVRCIRWKAAAVCKSTAAIKKLLKSANMWLGCRASFTEVLKPRIRIQNRIGGIETWPCPSEFNQCRNEWQYPALATDPGPWQL